MTALRVLTCGVLLALSFLPAVAGEDCVAEDGWDEGLRYDISGREDSAPNGKAHAAVWTGSRMIVFGGYDGHEFHGSGGLYDPATDSWSPTSGVNSPGGRARPTAIWTGEYMVVWGGVFNTPTDVGGAYDPLTDTWRRFFPPAWLDVGDGDTAAAPAGRMVLVGGLTGQHAIYDPVGNSLTPVSTVGAPQDLPRRGEGGSVWTGEETLLWCWGLTSDGAVPPTMRRVHKHRYNPATDTWSSISEVGAPDLLWAASVWTGHEMVVWGIRRAADGTLVGDGGRYDPLTDRWTPMSQEGAPSPHSISMIFTGREVIVWGGTGTNNLGTGARYDPVADSWSPVTTEGAPPNTAGGTAVWADGVMLLYGGHQLDDDYQSFLSYGGRYYPALRHDEDSDGFTACEGDCDDAIATINPDGLDIPGNSLDENCDGARSCDPEAGWNRGQLQSCIVRDCQEKAKAGLISRDACLAAAGVHSRSARRAQ